MIFFKCSQIKVILPLFVLLATIAFSTAVFAVENVPYKWKAEWSKTDFSNSNVKFSEIMSGGPAKDGIPAINTPKFKPASKINNIKPNEPVVRLRIGNDVRAYPLSILMYHEIVNDVVGGVPVAVTFCPLCNAAIVFKRVVDGKILDFGTTGKLRFSDMIMYDRQTESWWQQFIGEGIVGEYTGSKIEKVRSRLESFSLFKQAYPQGKVLISNSIFRNYGSNPYVKYDSLSWPFLFKGKFNERISPLSRVVAVGKNAWPLSLLREKGTIIYNDLVISWVQGQNSALDNATISQGKDVGNAIVQRSVNGKMEDAEYFVPFAFAFKAFNPNGIIHIK